MESRNPFRCFDRGYIRQALAIAVVIIALAWVGKRFPIGSGSRIVIAVAEAIVFAFIVVSTLMRIRRLDEMLQRIHLIAIAVSFAVVALIVTGAEFLSEAGVGVPPLGMWLYGIMMAVWALGVAIISRRYR